MPIIDSQNHCRLIQLILYTKKFTFSVIITTLNQQNCLNGILRHQKPVRMQACTVKAKFFSGKLGKTCCTTLDLFD